jgi:hypothetical protein
MLRRHREHEFFGNALFGAVEADGDGMNGAAEDRRCGLVCQLLPQNESENLLVGWAKTRNENEQTVVQGIADRFVLDCWLDCNAGA